MKKSLIAAAVAGMAVSSSVFALNPTTNSPVAIIYAAGGTAQSQAAIFAASQLLNNVDIISNEGCNGKASGSYRIFFGTLKNAQGTFAAGTNTLLYYRFSGGSFPNGVQPQGLGSTLPYPTNIGTSVACAGQSYPLPTFALTDTTTTTDSVPDWGMSDEEVKLFNNAYNVPNASTANLLTTAQVGNISQAGIYENVFGIAVSNNVYTAACPKTNFTKMEMAGVLSGDITDWSQLQGDGGCAITAGPISLLDRTPGSGSKAAGNLYFLGYPGITFANPAIVSNFYALGLTPPARATCSGVYEDVGEGSNSNITADLALANASGGSCRAVAVLGGEFPPALNQAGTGVNQYSFTSINGVDPGLNGVPGGTISYVPMLTGQYDFFYTNSFNFRSKKVGTNAQHWVGDGTPYSTMITTVQNILKQNNLPGGSPTATADSPAGTLLDPNRSTFGACVTRGTRKGTSTNPLKMIVGKSDAGTVPALPTCLDHL